MIYNTVSGYTSLIRPTRSQMEVLVFKTSVDSQQHIDELAPILNDIIQPPKWNFDLEDCDRILRVESDQNISHNLVSAMKERGFTCVELT